MPNPWLRRLASMQANRHFVERTFENAQSTGGMADYLVRVGRPGIITWRWS